MAFFCYTISVYSDGFYGTVLFIARTRCLFRSRRSGSASRKLYTLYRINCILIRKYYRIKVNVRTFLWAGKRTKTGDYVKHQSEGEKRSTKTSKRVHAAQPLWSAKTKIKKKPFWGGATRYIFVRFRTKFVRRMEIRAEKITRSQCKKKRHPKRKFCTL